MRGFISLGVLVAFVASSSFAAEEAPQKPAEYLPPEHFEGQQKLNEYPAHALKFLADHPSDTRCPRVLSDIVMMATLGNQPDAAKNAKLRLMMHCTNSLHAHHMVKMTPVNDLKGLLKERFTSTAYTLDRDSLNRFLEAIKLCSKHHGAAIGDDELWAQAALAAPDAETAARLKALIKEPGRSAETVTIVLDTRLTLCDKFIALQELRDFNTARAFQRYLLTQLTDEERADQGVQVVVIENLLHDQKFADAVPLLAELCKVSRSPQHLYWHAVALAASNDLTAAQELLATLNKEHPSDEWAKAGAELAETLEHVDAALREQTNVLNASISQFLTAPPEVLEATICWRDEEEHLWSAYVGIDVAKDKFEFVTTTGDRTRFAYRVSAEDCQLFVEGDPTIRQFDSKGMCPVFTSALHPKQGGGFNLSFNFNTAPQGSGALRQSLHNMLNGAPLVLTEAGRKELMQHALRSGNFPRRVQKDGDHLVLEWIRPALESPRLEKLTMRVDLDRRITSVTKEDGSGIAAIKYGATADVKLASPRWPTLPIETVAEFGGQDMFRMLGAVVALMDVKKPAASMAEGKPARLPR